MEKAKVSQLEHKNQFIIETDHSVIFQSYSSTIAIWDYQTHKLTLGRDWDFSNTTRKHLYKFIGEYTRQTIEATGNTRKEIQRLIDAGVIAYDESL